ncbi:Na(+)/H(+) exchange regulatory cofactor NHE-RF2 [Halotydeus destructor]|nr:Na(+)/H(+) exchange regulatory cofactor NHE-RF2 [Halotydeus destructor]
MDEKMDLPAEAPVPKLCQLVKWADFDGYGFNLHAEKTKNGQYIGKVDPGSPAHLAGLREGDRIIEVNGVNIANENHRQVVERIKAIANETRLLVIDDEGDKWYKERKMVIKGTQSNVQLLRTPSSRPAVVEDEGGDDEADQVLDSDQKEESEIEKETTNEQAIVQDVVIVEANDDGVQSEPLVEETPRPELERVESSDSAYTSQQNDSIIINNNNNNTESDKLAELKADTQVSEEKSGFYSLNGVPHREEAPASPRQNGGSGHPMVDHSFPQPPKVITSLSRSPVTSKVHESNKNQSDGSDGLADSGKNSPAVPDSPASTKSATSSGMASISPLPPVGDLNLNMTVSEMRQLLAQKKKTDAKKAQLDLRQKYEIIQQM